MEHVLTAEGHLRRCFSICPLSDRKMMLVYEGRCDKNGRERTMEVDRAELDAAIDGILSDEVLLSSDSVRWRGRDGAYGFKF